MTVGLSSVSPKPGVYLLKDSGENVLYVGKAKNLRNRLRSHFRRPSPLDARKSSMMKSVKDFSYIVTGNELEALVLEASLIKRHKPKFNVILRDDKSYPYLKLTMGEKWPRLEITRRIKKDGSLYFGPYVPAGGMHELLYFVRRHFKIRPCRYGFERPMRPCIEHQMGRCGAPCAGKVDEEEYAKEVSEVRLFLSGEKKGLLSGLKRRMRELSEELRFEDAASIRDTLRSLDRAWESQKIISPALKDIDVIGFWIEGPDASFEVFFVRNGVMIGARDFYLKGVSDMPRKELMHGFLEMFYSKELIPPPEIVMRPAPEDRGVLLKWLEGKRGGKVAITVPGKGKKLEILSMAEENAREIFMRKGKTSPEALLIRLKERFSLRENPDSIGAFDVSTTSGRESVGAFVLWQEGEFRKDMYRTLRIKGVRGTDDFAMTGETVLRTLKNLGGETPKLVLIDGGRGHLEAARGAASSLETPPPEFISIAKRPDRAYSALSDAPVDLEDKDASSLLLKKIRDEAHRFAVSFHRRLRGRRLLESPLQDVPGIGKKRRLSLLKGFGSLDALRGASVEELASLPGMNRKAAEAVEAALLKDRMKNMLKSTERRSS